MRRNRIIIITSVDWFFLSHFMGRALAAVSAGYKVSVATKVTKFEDQISRAGIDVLPLPISRNNLNFLKEIQVIYKFVKLYRSERPDILHLVALKPILLGGVASLFYKDAVVISAIVGGGYIFSSGELRARAIRVCVTPFLRFVLGRRSRKVVFENVDDLAFFSKDFGVSRRNAVLIRGSGVNTRQYAKRAVVSGTPIVLMGCRLLWDKGVGEFVSAAKHIMRLGIAAKFVVVGERDPENFQCISKEVIHKWVEEGHVEFWGYRTDVPELLSKSAIACLPSYREGLPRFLLEAMAASCPCVATKVPGCREVVLDGKTGLLVEPKDSIGLAQALIRLLTSPDTAIDMGNKGREFVLTHFSDEVVNKLTLRVYSEVDS